MTKIYDDRGKGEDFFITKILFANKKLVVAEVTNEDKSQTEEVMIYLDDNRVVSEHLQFYYADTAVPVETRQCYADQDGVTHAMCAGMPSCDKCSSYR